MRFIKRVMELHREHKYMNVDTDRLKHFHLLFGVRKPRISYQKKDFIDYALMTLVTALVIYFTYGPGNLMSVFGIALCGYMIAAFPVRHGFELRMPLIMRRPQDILYMAVYKIRNIKSFYFLTVGLLVLENYLIYLTPGLPHKLELTHSIAVYLFYAHFGLITVYRTIILGAHLYKKEHVREVLMESAWKNRVAKPRSITLEILHAYFTGVLTHIVLIAPWYIVIAYFEYSLVFLPVVCVLDIIINLRFLKVMNAWFYRDHWLGHNSEFEFLYLHGTHHDAIPSGLIGVAGNGHLEGFLRHAMAFPTPFFNPLISCLVYTIDVKKDIEVHQYIPGVFPQLSREFQEVTQHSTHHFGRVEPYGFAVKLDQPGVSEDLKKEFKMMPDELRNSARLDEQLGFKWDNHRHKWYLGLLDKYQK